MAVMSKASMVGIGVGGSLERKGAWDSMPGEGVSAWWDGGFRAVGLRIDLWRGFGVVWPRIGIGGQGGDGLSPGTSSRRC